MVKVTKEIAINKALVNEIKKKISKSNDLIADRDVIRHNLL
jgi:hypothetical protein